LSASPVYRKKMYAIFCYLANKYLKNEILQCSNVNVLFLMSSLFSSSQRWLESHYWGWIWFKDNQCGQ